jgi:ribonuclease BN (tRNA processing enzyme)
MRLTVVGCAGSYPTAQSPGSCYLLEHDGHRVVLDLGNGAWGALQAYLDVDDPDALDALVLSHCHVDHCADAASLYVYRHYHPSRRWPRLVLVGPREAPARMAAIYGMRDVSPLARVFDPRVLSADSQRVGPFTIRAVPARHPVEAYSVRVDAGGRSLTFSGDTGPSAALVDLARGTDIALFEATFVGAGNPPDLHMTGADAGRAAREAGAGRLVLTHRAGWNDDAQVLAEAAAEFPGPIDLAVAGLTLTC